MNETLRGVIQLIFCGVYLFFMVRVTSFFTHATNYVSWQSALMK